MTELGEHALTQIVRTFAAVQALVGDRVTWDDEEIDLPHPSVTLRTLSTRLPAAELRSRGGVRQSLVEISSHDSTSHGASALNDLVVDAMTPYDGVQSEVQLDGGGSVWFGGIQLTDVQQASSGRARSYRKSSTFSVWLYE